jgi:hypothetical protein
MGGDRPDQRVLHEVIPTPIWLAPNRTSPFQGEVTEEQAMKTIALAGAGVILVLLGGLWLLQGLGAVTVPPLLCLADCEPLEGPSPTWAVIGFLALAAGVFALVRAFRRRKP